MKIRFSKRKIYCTLKHSSNKTNKLWDRPTKKVFCYIDKYDHEENYSR